MLDGLLLLPAGDDAPERMVELLEMCGTDRILVGSAADWGRSDPLLTVATARAMLAAGFGEEDVDRVFWRNPAEFCGQSGRLDLPAVAAPSAAGEPFSAAGSPA